MASFGCIPLLAQGAGGVGERSGRPTSSGRSFLLRVFLEVPSLSGGGDFYGGELHELNNI